MDIRRLFIFFTMLLIASCYIYDEYGCDKHQPACIRDYQVSLTYSFAPDRDTFQVGESVIWDIDIPYEIWDSLTSKNISLEEFELLPIFVFYKIDFESKTFYLPSYSVVQLDSVIYMENLDTSNIQGTSIGNRLYFNLEEQEDRRKGRLKIHFNEPGTYFINARVSPETNDDYFNGKLRFDTIEDVCCRQTLDAKFLYTGESVPINQWFQQDSIFHEIGFDGQKHQHNMLDPWTSKDRTLIFTVVE